MFDKPYISLAAKVVAPDTATLVYERMAALLEEPFEIVIAADVPVTRVTLGLVPGEPERVAVYVDDVVVPSPDELAATSVTHTHTEPL